MSGFLEFLASANLVQILIGGVIGYAFKSGNKKLIAISVVAILAVVGIDYYNKNLKPTLTFSNPMEFNACETGLRWQDLEQWEAEFNPSYCCSKSSSPFIG